MYDGKKVADIVRDFETTKPNDGSRERSKTEWARLAIALAVAVFALVAGAKDQIAKLDVISGFTAIFALGFGADQIKNIVTIPPGGKK